MSTTTLPAPAGRDTSPRRAVGSPAMTKPRPCDRGEAHGPHTYVTHPDATDDHQCPGRTIHHLSVLLRHRPALADIGVTPRMHELGVMSA